VNVSQLRLRSEKLDNNNNNNNNVVEKFSTANMKLLYWT